MVTYDPMLDHRARLERDQFEAAERRGRALVEQCSPQNSPAARVNAWERLHDLRLPIDPKHAILPRVAEQTALDLADVLEVQRLRAQPAL
jgi:hypothetical protein